MTEITENLIMVIKFAIPNDRNPGRGKRQKKVISTPFHRCVVLWIMNFKRRDVVRRREVALDVESSLVSIVFFFFFNITLCMF